MLRHPATLVGLAVSLALVGARASGEVPVLFQADERITVSLLPLAGLTVVVANVVTLRAHRDGAEAHFDAFPVSPGQRVAAWLLALAWPTAAACVAVGIEVAGLALSGGVGTPRAAELATGPLVVALGGVLGVALGAWVRWALAAPLVALGLAILQVDLLAPVPTVSFPGRLSWLAPAFSNPVPVTPPAPLALGRPGAHLVWLGGLAIALAGVALWRHRRPRLLAVAAVGLAVAVAGGVVETRPVPESTVARMAGLLAHPARHQVCRAVGGATFCAYPAFAPWVSRWATAALGVMQGVPVGAAGHHLVVRQLWPLGYGAGPWLPSDASKQIAKLANLVFFGPATFGASAYVSTSWGRHGSLGQDQLSLALQVARFEVGLPNHDPLPGCSSSGATSTLASGQAREAVALWLAAQATPASATALRAAVAGAYGDSLPTPATPRAPYVSWTTQGAELALAMLALPHARVEQVLGSRWGRWVAPTTTSAQLAAAVGVALPPKPGPPPPPPASLGVTSQTVQVAPIRSAC
ncbi:MAG: hypothetical protein ACRDZQ_03055 [Acidimicrobiales bacterium]